MPVFQYRARDSKGSIKTGVIDTVNKEAASSILRDRQMIPLQLKEQKEGSIIANLKKKFVGIPLKDKVILTRQLAAIINAGIPLLQALQLVVDQTDNKQLQNVLKQVLNDIQGGNTFAEALAKRPKVFSNLFINVVKAGEVSGTLDVSLLRLADQMEKDQEVRGKIKGAMVLPGLVMLVLVGVVILMSVVVIPQLADLFAQAGGALPLPTRIMMMMSRFFTDLWWLALLLTVTATISINKFLSTKQGKNMMDVVMLKMPVFGNLSRLVIYARFTKVLAILLSSGVPLLKGMEIVADLVGNHIYGGSINAIAKKVEKGVPLSTGIKEESLYPAMIPQMVNIGEQTGAVDEMLLKLADFYEGEVDNIVKNLTTLLEPMLMVMMGGAVAFIVLAVLMPIYSLVNVIE